MVSRGAMEEVEQEYVQQRDEAQSGSAVEERARKGGEEGWLQCLRVDRVSLCTLKNAQS